MRAQDSSVVPCAYCYFAKQKKNKKYKQLQVTINTRYDTTSKNNYTPEEVLLDYLEIKYYLSGSCNCSTCEKCLLVRLMEEMWLKRVSASRLLGSVPRNCPTSSMEWNSRSLNWYRCRIPKESNSKMVAPLFPFQNKSDIFFLQCTQVWGCNIYTHTCTHSHLFPGLHSLQFWLLAVSKTGGGEGLGSQLVRDTHTDIHT